jgi:predicted DCC family thiol-disulfide oxidoreductase YuxK
MHLVLYDGVCGLCDRFVQFLVRIDRHDRLRFAALQGAIGRDILSRTGRDADALSTVVVVADYQSAEERILERSDAGLFVIEAAGGPYRVLAALRIVPRFIRDAVYGLIARHRYRIFGRFDACPVPSPKTRAKFLDLAPRAATT